MPFKAEPIVLDEKMPTLGKNLAEFSLDTVPMFARDAGMAGYSL